tara:strand:- start:2686 stop:3594 length:909 start_codon:yes stop_codon:yes gene_type:complete
MKLIKENNHKKFKKKKIFIIGELILDKNFFVSNIGKSLETNNPKYFIDRMVDEMGGAGKVYESLKKIINKRSFLITSKNYKTKLRNDMNILFFNSKVKNIVKNRFWEKKSKIIQINEDYKKKYPDKNKFNKFVIKKLKQEINKIDSIIISDYNHGLINSNMISVIKKMIKNKRIDVYVDKQIRKSNDFPEYYNNLDYLVINQLEYKLLKKKFRVKGSVISSLKDLKSKLNFDNIILKKGKNGSCMIDKSDSYYYSKNINSKRKYNVSGAGDHFLAMFVSLSNNTKSEKRLLFANQWANYNLR